MKSFSDPPGIALFKFLLCIELIELNIFKSHEFYSSLKGLVGGEEGRRGRVVKCQLPMYCKIRQIFVSKKKKERISKKRKKKKKKESQKRKKDKTKVIPNHSLTSSIFW